MLCRRASQYVCIYVHACIRTLAVRGALALLALALDLEVIGQELDVAVLRLDVAAQEVLGEVAGLVSDGTRAGQVGVRGGQALLVVQGLVLGGLGDQVLDQTGVGGLDHQEDGSGGLMCYVDRFSRKRL